MLKIKGRKIDRKQKQREEKCFKISKISEKREARRKDRENTLKTNNQKEMTIKRKNQKKRDKNMRQNK